MFVVKKPHTRTNVPKTIRFTEELNQDLQNLALKTEISFNELVIQCCQYALEQYAEDEPEGDYEC